MWYISTIYIAYTYSYAYKQIYIASLPEKVLIFGFRSRWGWFVNEALAFKMIFKQDLALKYQALYLLKFYGCENVSLSHIYRSNFSLHHCSTCFEWLVSTYTIARSKCCWFHKCVIAYHLPRNAISLASHECSSQRLYTNDEYHLNHCTIFGISICSSGRERFMCTWSGKIAIFTISHHRSTSFFINASRITCTHAGLISTGSCQCSRIALYRLILSVSSGTRLYFVENVSIIYFFIYTPRKQVKWRSVWTSYIYGGIYQMVYMGKLSDECIECEIWVSGIKRKV